MSLYTTTSGNITYTNKEEFEGIVKELQEAEYLNGHLQWLDECQNSINYEGDLIDVENMTIEIPCALYRNISRFKFFTPSAKGAIHHSSEDGGHSAWSETESGETSHFG